MRPFEYALIGFYIVLNLYMLGLIGWAAATSLIDRRARRIHLPRATARTRSLSERM